MATLEITRPAHRIAEILYAVLNPHVPLPRAAHLWPIMKAHGWPDVVEVRRQADHLARLGRLDVTFEIEVPGPARSFRIDHVHEK